MPNMEEIKRKAQSAVYTAAEKAQDAATAAGEKAGELKDYAGEKAGALKELAGEKAGAFIGYAGEKAEALKEFAGEKAGAFIDYAGEKAGALKGYAGEKAALITEKRNLARNYQALGEWYVAQCGDDAPEAVADVVKAIHASQAKLAELRERGAEDAQPDEDGE